MPKYHRVLVRYRLPTSDQWSGLHWCDIERTESNEFRVRVASAVQDASMPRDEEFEDLAPELAKKLLVIDCSGPDVTPGGWPLLVRSSSELESYCLVFTANAMYRVDFQSRTNLFMQNGQCWRDGKHFVPENRIGLQNCFTRYEIDADKRLAMRTNSSEDNYAFLVCNPELIIDLKRQYLESTITAVLQPEEAPPQVQTSVVDPSHDQTNQYWLTTECRQNVAIVKDSVESALVWDDRTLLHDTVCSELSSVKNCSSSPEEYHMALRTLLGIATIPEDSSIELTTAVQAFRDRMLRNSMDLNAIFGQGRSSHPCLASVCQYVTECVFLELKKQDPSYRDLTSEMLVRSCPASYLEVHLGRPNQQSERLVGVSSTDADAIYALFLQQEGFQDLQDRPANLADYDFAGGGHPQSAIWGSRLPRSYSIYSDDMQEGQDGLLNPTHHSVRPQQGCEGSGAAGARSNPSGSNSVPLHPRQHGRYGLFRSLCGYTPSAAPQVNRLLLCWMGAGLCALGVYLAFSSFFTGAAIIAGGLLCLLAATLPANRNPAPVDGASISGFGR